LALGYFVAHTFNAEAGGAEGERLVADYKAKNKIRVNGICPSVKPFFHSSHRTADVSSSFQVRRTALALSVFTLRFGCVNDVVFEHREIVTLC